MGGCPLTLRGIGGSYALSSGEVGSDVLAEAGELAHHAAADGGILGLADEQQGVDAGEHTVDIGNAALILEVDAAAHAPDDELCTDGLGKVGGETLIADYMNSGFVLVQRSDALYALVKSKQRALLNVDADGDVQLVDDA